MKQQTSEQIITTSRVSIEKIRICCYQFESAVEEDNRQFLPSRAPLINREQQSKIKFEVGSWISKRPIYSLLNQLYGNPRQYIAIIKQLGTKRINPILRNSITDRDDLEYYIPQLITYMVFQQNLRNEIINQLIMDACSTDFFFAHSVLFYLTSLSINKDGQQVTKIRQFLRNQFYMRMEMYDKSRLSGSQFIKQMVKQPQKMIINEDNKSDFYNSLILQRDLQVKVQLKNYHYSGFQATPKFWTDLVDIGEEISLCVDSQSRSEALILLLKDRISPKLPASIYVPFFREQIRMYNILAIHKGLVFSTKQRSPYSVYIQLYRQDMQRPQEDLLQQIDIFESSPRKKKKNFINRLYDKLSKPFTASDKKNTLGLKKKMSQKKQKSTFQNFRGKSQSVSFYEQGKSQKILLSEIYENKSDEGKNSDRYSIDSSVKNYDGEDKLNQIQNDKYFPKKYSELCSQYKQQSQFKNLKSWRLVHLMIKIGDDLKQEQFAMQLISRFQYIFQEQKVQLPLFPYEVVSLGPDYGLIQMLNDVTTLDSLFKKLVAQNKTLQDFFDSYYVDKEKAKSNFMKSLASYSLVTYFLQVKDRHNGNILLHRDGYIIHIDFGFLLSNAPGKGVQLQKSVPFKLLSQYVDVLGSVHSELFIQYRRLFEKGFKAVIKHQQMILALVRMMYMSHGQTMQCFKTGESAIYQLQERLNPPHHNLQKFCYQLINNSLDNWRARWYDKFQYFLQKIYY